MCAGSVARSVTYCFAGLAGFFYTYVSFDSTDYRRFSNMSKLCAIYYENMKNF